MDGLTPMLFPIVLDVLVAVVLAIVLLFVITGSLPTPGQAGAQARGRNGARRLLGPGAIVALLCWVLLVAVYPQAGGQSLTPTPVPTHAPSPTARPAPTPTSKPSPAPTQKPSPVPTRRPGH